VNKTYYTYILRCVDKTLYTGWTIDLEARISSHNSGNGAKYTRGRLPVKIVAYWQFGTKSEAMSFENKIKRLSRQKKELLIAQNI
jgi:putative endonuclease